MAEDSKIMNTERKLNTFVWSPAAPRTDLYSRPLPNQKLETRSPRFWLARDGDDLYFVNNEQTSLPLVTGSSDGFFTSDDGSHSVGSKGKQYTNILPNEAVKIDSYDPILDSDYYLCASILIELDDESRLYCQTESNRGGVKETVLLWDNGDAGKGVQVIQKPAPIS